MLAISSNILKDGNIYFAIIIVVFMRDYFIFIYTKMNLL